MKEFTRWCLAVGCVIVFLIVIIMLNTKMQEKRCLKWEAASKSALEDSLTDDALINHQLVKTLGSSTEIILRKISSVNILFNQGEFGSATSKLLEIKSVERSKISAIIELISRYDGLNNSIPGKSKAKTTPETIAPEIIASLESTKKEINRLIKELIASLLIPEDCKAFFKS